MTTADPTVPAAVIDQDSASQPGETYTVAFRGTLAECEAWVAAREQIEPANVHRGRYGIDADFGESEVETDAEWLATHGGGGYVATDWS